MKPEQIAEYVCPECGGSGLLALCGKPVDWSGPCVMVSGHDSPCWGEEDVAGDWTPAVPCRTCGPSRDGIVWNVPKENETLSEQLGPPAHIDGEADV